MTKRNIGNGLRVEALEGRDVPTLLVPTVSYSLPFTTVNAGDIVISGEHRVVATQDSNSITLTTTSLDGVVRTHDIRIGTGPNQIRPGGKIVVTGTLANDHYDLNVNVPCHVDGGWGKDFVWGGSRNDVLRGNIGDDILKGWSGNDDLHGGDGDDDLFGEGGRDFLFGGDDDDHLEGGLGDDFLAGEDGEDNLYGDLASGGTPQDGNDELDGGADGDNFTGGGGADVFKNYSYDAWWLDPFSRDDKIRDFNPTFDGDIKV